MVRSLGLAVTADAAPGEPPVAARRRPSATPLAVLIVIAVLAATGSVAGVAATRTGGPPAAPPAAGLAAVTVGLVVASRLRIDLRYRGEVDAFDLFEAALTPVIFVVPGTWAVLLVTAAKAAVQLWQRFAAVKLAFNVALWACCAGLAALTYAAAAPPGVDQVGRLPALAAAMAVAAAVNVSGMAVILALVSGPAAARLLLRPAQLWRTTSITAVTVTIGMLVAVAGAADPAALWLLLPPIVVLHLAGRGYTVRSAERDRLHRLQTATHALSAAPDPRDAIAGLLAEVLRCYDARAADAVLVDSDDNWELHRHRDGRVDAPARPTPSERDPLLETLLTGPLPLHVTTSPQRPAGLRLVRRLRDHLAGAHRATRATDGAAAEALRRSGWRDCLAAPLRVDGGVRGLLVVYDRTGPADLDSADGGLLDAFAAELTAALERSRLLGLVLRTQEDLRRVVAGSGDGITALDEHGRVVVWNPALSALTGYSADDMIGADTLQRLDVRDPAGRAVSLQDWATRRDDPPNDLVITARDGRRRWVSCSYARTCGDVPSAAPSRDLLVLMARDVTDSRRHRELITGQVEILELVARDEPLPVTLGSVARLVARQLDDAPVAIVLAGDSPDSALRPAAQAGAAMVAGALDALAPEIRRAHRSSERIVSVTPDAGTGDPVVFEVTRIPGSEPDKTGGFVAVQRDTAGASTLPDREVLDTAAGLAGIAVQRDATRAHLAHQATHDPLTGLPNRVLFLDRCTHALDRMKRSGGYAAVLFLDLDRFKIVNDSLGHDAGDQLLIAVANRLRAAIRPPDTVARLGGDEFTILCEDIIDAATARAIAERILALFATPFEVHGREVFESASVGIALDLGTASATSLVDKADAAMYRAKDQGGTRYEFFDTQLRHRAEAQLTGYAGLRRAVVHGELVVHYQPRISLDDGALVGVEALVRWRHPTRGLLPPAEFIDLAEETGLIMTLGRQVLRSSLRQLREWQRTSPVAPLRMSVNISARQLTEPDLVTVIASALAESGVAPSALLLEITETVLLTDSPGPRSAIARLKDLGVGLSLDDFGTGHSSLTRLRDLPVEELKIDRRFVAGMTSARPDEIIVTAIVHLAHDLGLRVVAEGIETRGQVNRLRDLRCDVGQGHYLGRPSPADEISQLTRAAAG